MQLYEDQPSGTVTRARELRREASEPERRLLRALREAFPDLKWRHQAPVGLFYADILCFSAKLIVEVDGDDHMLKIKADAMRTRFLNNQGYRVIRFANADVMGNMDGVIASISLSLREREGARSPQASGKGEGDRAQEKGAAA